MKLNIGQILSATLVFFIAVIETLLGLRFVLMLLAASSDAEFTLMIYEMSDPFAAPFSGVFPSFEAARFTLEISTVLAMIVYGIVGAIFFYLAKNFGSVTLKDPAAKPMVESAPSLTMPPYQGQTVQQQPMQVPQYQPPVPQSYQTSTPQTYQAPIQSAQSYPSQTPQTYQNPQVAPTAQPQPLHTPLSEMTATSGPLTSQSSTVASEPQTPLTPPPPQANS